MPLFKKRLPWAIQHQDIDWNEVVFTDVSSFHMKQVIRNVWKRRGDKYCVNSEAFCENLRVGLF